MECMFCKSSNITKKIKITGGGGTVHKAGLIYTEKKIWIKTEPFVADMCNDCGTVRIHVKNTTRNWTKSK